MHLLVGDLATSLPSDSAWAGSRGGREGGREVRAPLEFFAKFGPVMGQLRKNVEHVRKELRVGSTEEFARLPARSRATGALSADCGSGKGPSGAARQNSPVKSCIILGGYASRRQRRVCGSGMPDRPDPGTVRSGPRHRPVLGE